MAHAAISYASVPSFSVRAAFQYSTGPLVKLVVIVHPLQALLVARVSLFWRAWLVPVYK